MTVNITKKFTALFCVLMWLALGASVSFAYLPQIGLTPLDLGDGARALGMGDAVGSRSEFLSAVLSNPASINRSYGLETGSSRSGTFLVSEAFPLDQGNTCSITVANTTLNNWYTPDGQLATLTGNTLIGTVSQRLAFVPAFQDRPILGDSVVGASVKWIVNESLTIGTAQHNASGMEASLGWLYEPRAPWSAGISLNNILPSISPAAGRMQWDDGSYDSIPAKARIGITDKLIGDQGQFLTQSDLDLLVAGEEDLAFNKTPSLGYLGLEFSRRDNLYLRTGTNSRGFSAGLGIRGKEWGGDVAYYDSAFWAFSFSYFPEAWRFKEKVIPETTDIIKTLYPGAGQLVTFETFVIVSGQVKDENYRVTVNGNLIYVDKDGNFSVYVPLNLGKNLIKVIARSEWEKQTMDVRVLRKAQVLVTEEEQIDRIFKTEIDPLIDGLTKQISDLNTKIYNEKNKKKKQELTAKLKVLGKQLGVVAQKRDQLYDRQKEVLAQKESAENLISMGIIDNAPDKKIQLGKTISRGELAVLIAKSTGYPVSDVFEPPYSDVPISDPNAPYIKLVKDLGLMSSADGNNFYPDRAVSEKEGKAIFKKLGALK